ncbi:hypothetical protein DFH08DRAFT_825072 [Mycena albidolilacea]|uniref:Uncharacterized protein n=1 Tax=Mycena albidolilacea TaxID=1033008 RepID=A0AAD7E9N9_9AGAR|nr:hypothetical protein DFH08DRAFT_825072 [Mycena albidolilacea]
MEMRGGTAAQQRHALRRCENKWVVPNESSQPARRLGVSDAWIDRGKAQLGVDRERDGEARSGHRGTSSRPSLSSVSQEPLIWIHDRSPAPIAYGQHAAKARRPPHERPPCPGACLPFALLLAQQLRRHQSSADISSAALLLPVLPPKLQRACVAVMMKRKGVGGAGVDSGRSTPSFPKRRTDSAHAGGTIPLENRIGEDARRWCPLLGTEMRATHDFGV